MDTSRLAALVTAAELGSLTAASRRLGAQLSTVSRQIADLEQEVGAVLLVRTGRGVRPTPAGERFLERARHVLRELDTAAAEARGETGLGVSHLRLSTPLEMALSLLPPCLAALHREHPGVTVDLHSEARRVSLLEEDYDAALRLGSLPDSSLIGRPLGRVGLLLCGAPGLVPKRASMAGLDALRWVAVAGTGEELRGRLRGKAVTLRCTPRLRVSTFSEAAEVAAATGLAVMLPSYTAVRFLEDGRLVRLAPRFELPAVDAHMLLAPRHRGTPVLRRLAELARDRLGAIEATVKAIR